MAQSHRQMTNRFKNSPSDSTFSITNEFSSIQVAIFVLNCCYVWYTRHDFNDRIYVALSQPQDNTAYHAWFIFRKLSYVSIGYTRTG